MNAQTLNLRALARALGGEVTGGQVLAPGPNHSAHDRSLAVRLSPDAPEGFLVHSYAGDDAIFCRDHVRRLAGLPSFAPAERSAGPSVVAEYVYRLADGSPYLRVLRTDPKGFWQNHWTGAQWIKGKPAGDPVPYRLPELLEAIHDTVFLVEGEKDADRLASHGFVATTAPEGAGKWRASLNRWFEDKTVYILADNDKAGRAHAETVARNLSGCASSVRVIALPGLKHQGDVSDWLDAGGDTSELVHLCQAQPIWAPSPAQAPELASPAEGPANGLRRAYFGDLETMPSIKPWMIKGVLAKGETSAWIAPPKGGKSTLVVDLAIAVASGRDWRGYENKGASGVLYCALERASDVKRMMLAHKKRNKFGALPISIADEIVDMMDPGCVELIVETIRDCSINLGTEIGLLVIDTFAKSIAAGGGDEDKARDQGKVFANLQRIKEQTGVHCLIIGHTGKDADRGARGSNALLGDVDMMVEISGDDIRKATVTGANDRDTGLVTAFRIEPYVLGHDEDGAPITTRIIDPELISEDELPGQPGQFRRDSVPPRMPRGEKGHLVKIVEKAISEAGEKAPPSNHIPAGVRVVSRDTLRTYARTAGYRDGHSAETFKRSFNRDLSALAGDGVIVIHADNVWMTSHAGTKRDTGTLPGHFELSHHLTHCHERETFASGHRDTLTGTLSGQKTVPGQGHRDTLPPPKGGRVKSVPDVPVVSHLEQEGDDDADRS